LTQFVQQSRILDGDYGLSCEVLHQRDLFVCEWPDFLPVDADDPDQSILLNVTTPAVSTPAKKAPALARDRPPIFRQS
jgi:hypothetical protein